MNKSFAKYVIYNKAAREVDDELQPEDFLKYTNELWNFSLSLNSLTRLRLAGHLLDEQGVNVNYLYAGLWAGQKEHILTGAWREKHSQLHKWHKNHTLVARNQRIQIEKKLKDVHYLSSTATFAKMREHILNAEYLMEQQEQALLYSYFVHKIAFEKSTSTADAYAKRLECVAHNFSCIISDAKLAKTVENISAIAEFLVVILDDEDAKKLSQELFS